MSEKDASLYIEKNTLYCRAPSKDMSIIYPNSQFDNPELKLILDLQNSTIGVVTNIYIDINKKITQAIHLEVEKTGLIEVFQIMPRIGQGIIGQRIEKSELDANTEILDDGFIYSPKQILPNERLYLKQRLFNAKYVTRKEQTTYILKDLLTPNPSVSQQQSITTVSKKLCLSNP